MDEQPGRQHYASVQSRLVEPQKKTKGNVFMKTMCVSSLSV